MKKTFNNGAPRPDKFYLATTNLSIEDAPAYALLQVVNASAPDADGSYSVTLPDGTAGTYWINCPVATPASGPGAATNIFPAVVAYDTADIPAVGEEWGPVAGSWLLTNAGTGFRIIGAAADGLVRVEKISAGGTSEPALRRFNLTASKFSTDASVNGKFLDDAGAEVGSDVVFYDPHLLFAGQPDDYITGQGPFTGVAILRADLAAVEPPRWEIVELEGFARWIIAEYTAGDSGSADPRKTSNWYSFYGVYPITDGYQRRIPQAANEPVRWHDMAANALVAPSPGDKVLMMLEDADGFVGSPPAGWEDQAWAPMYLPVSSLGGGGKRVRGTVVDPGVGFVLRTAPTFQITGLSNVFGTTTLPADPLTVNQIFQQGYFAGQPTEAQFNETTGQWDNLPDPTKLGCHLNADAYGFIYVTPSTLAGSGLSVSVGTGVGGCDQLTVTGGGAASYDEGYCVEIEDLATDKIHVNQITSAAGTQATDINTTKQQFWVHFAGAAARTDAKWKTGNGYSVSGSAFQFILNEGDTWNWKDIGGYDVEATQLLGHVSGSWQLKTIRDWLKLLSGYAAGTAQLLGHAVDEDPEWDSIDAWLNRLGNYMAGNMQSIGHDATGPTVWQDDGIC